ncbi:hypothetical protein ACVWZM_005254 [Bradyrhizobium sp. USDA 4501]
MKLINEIVAEALDNDKPIASLLRKCLVLAFDLKNDKLKGWVEGELNGYDDSDNVPSYRTANLFSKGNFSGPFNAWIPNRPLPLGVLDEKHREILTPTYFTEPIAAYELTRKDGKGTYVINWPPDLILLYQTKFIKGYGLAQAWQEVSEGLFRSIVDTVRSRLLRFALEIREELGAVDDEPLKIPTAKVDAAVTNFIFGGNNVINSQVEQLSQQGDTIIAGDFTALAEALKAIGVAESDIAEFKEAADLDAAGHQSGVGQNTQSWLSSLASKMGGAAWKIGTAAGIDVVRDLITKHLGS